ncbi:MAG: type II toxin-antitoxin system death-on-curing family toxin [Chitinophagaceae bacterium]|nr:type II toxin-antitoxin system death-on-curing family toxin [Chitinophagaceae bacterium]
MITKEEVLLIHNQVVLLHGGANGVRDMNGLESAIARPYQSFGGDDLYPSSFEKAAAIGESIIMNHPFVDGNKRTGYVLMETVLRLEGFKISAADDELYQFVIGISTGAKRYEEIVEWLKKNTKAAG